MPLPSLTTFAPVPGSPTPRELAMADGSVRKYRIGPWSSWGNGGSLDAQSDPPRKMGPSRSSEPVASVWREPPPESLSMSRSPRLTQNRLLLCLVPRERAEIPDLLCRFDREECSGGQGRPRLRLAEMSQLHEGPFSFLARLACARRRRRYAEASCFRNAVRTRGVGPLAHQQARGSEVA